VYIAVELTGLIVTILLAIRPWYLFLIVWFAMGIPIAMLAGVYVKVLFPPKIKQYYPDDLSLNLGTKR